MRRTVVLFLLSSLAILLLAAPQSRGDGVDTFTYTEVSGGLVYSATWQSLATPDSFNPGFDFLSQVSIDIYLDGGLWLSGEPAELTFYNQGVGNGELVDISDLYGDSLFGLDGFGQLYSGSEDSPTFTAGTYTGTDPDNSGTAATLVISAPISAPEPSSLLLLFSSLLGIAGVLFVRRLEL